MSDIRWWARLGSKQRAPPVRRSASDGQSYRLHTSRPRPPAGPWSVSGVAEEQDLIGHPGGIDDQMPPNATVGKERVKDCRRVAIRSWHARQVVGCHLRCAEYPFTLDRGHLEGVAEGGFAGRIAGPRRAASAAPRRRTESSHRSA